MIDIKLDVVRKLIRIMERSQINGLEIKDGPWGIRLVKSPKNTGPPLPVQPLTISTPEATSPPKAEPSPVKKIQKVKSPLVGTFYDAAALDTEPYVRIGDMVQNGQTLCHIVAMKLKNEITSDYAGRIIEIHVENGQPVEYDEDLFTIELPEP